MSSPPCLPCSIEAIGHAERPTTPATGYAVLRRNGQRMALCDAHAETLRKAKPTRDGEFTMSTLWSLEPLCSTEAKP